MHLHHRFACFMLATLAAWPIYAQDSAPKEEADTSSAATADSPTDVPDATAAAATAEPPAPVVDAADPASTTTGQDAATTHGESPVEAEATPEVPEAGAEAGTDTRAPAATSAIVIPPPPTGMGQVVFFREKKFAGAGVRFKVRERDEELGKLGSGVYFVHPTAPGVHEYVVHSEAEDKLTLEVEEGETYYVQGSVTMGIMVGRPNLSPSDEAAFAAESAKLKPAKE